MIRPVKLGVDLTCLSESWAGMQQYTAELSRQLARLGDGEIEFIGFPDIERWPEGSADSQTHTLSHAPDSRLIREQLVLPWASRRFDRLLVPAYLGPIVHFCPVDLIVYDLLFLRPDSGLSAPQRWYWRGLYRTAFRRAEKLFPISRATGRKLSRNIPSLEPKIGPVLYPGLRSFANEVDPGEPSPPAERPYILFVGTVSPRKNVERLIRWYGRSASSIRRRFDLRLAGKHGWGSPPPEDLHRPGRGIYWHGEVSDRELKGLYGGARVLALPSLGEGFGMPILEAFSHRLPVVLSDIPIFREVAGEAGFYLDPGSIAGWDEVFEPALTEESVREDKIHRGRDRLGRFDWENTARTYLREIGLDAP